MTTYLGKGCLPRVPFVNCRQFMYLVISLFGFEGRIWDLIVSVPDHCLSFYIEISHMTRHSSKPNKLRNVNPVRWGTSPSKHGKFIISKSKSSRLS